MPRTQIDGDQFYDETLYPKDIASINAKFEKAFLIYDQTAQKFKWVNAKKYVEQGLFELDKYLDYMPIAGFSQEMEKDGNNDIQPLNDVDISRIDDDEYELDENGDIMPKELETGV